VTLWVNVIVGFLQLILVVFLAVIAIYIGFFTINRTMKDVDVTSELNQGNKAIGIFVASVFIGITLTVYSCIQGILGGVNRIFADGSLTLIDSFDVVLSFFELILGILLSIGSIYLVILIFSRFIPKTDMIREMKNENIAFASIIAGMIIAVSLIIHIGVLGIITGLF
jgi:uncharacterized membrane protein YjfL (UPF0719 family)